MQAKVRDVLFKIATAAVCILAYGMSSRLEVLPLGLHTTMIHRKTYMG